MRTPENLAQIVRAVNEAAGVLESAGLAAEHNSETRPIGIRLLKMSDEAKGYSQYIGAYFRPARRAKLISPARQRWVDDTQRYWSPFRGGTIR
jgi:hypothetical protein